jgi:tRNA pseudouridine55 synthase
MARKRKGRPIDGWLVLDKPLGLSSATAVAKVKRALDAAKAGHGGTLDPLATGILPIALGEATKTVSFVMDGAKAYRFSVRWGVQTNTDDAEGVAVAENPHRPDAAAIRAVLPRFTGTIQQVPPVYSAIKVNGERAYALARADEEPELAARPVVIDGLDLVECPDPDTALLEVRCGKGTYVRALARDIALALGTVGHVVTLRRIACGPFREKDAISLDKLEGLGHIAAFADHVLPIATVLDDIPALALTEDEARRLASGQSVSLTTVASRSSRSIPPDGATVQASSQGRVVALARIESGMIRPVRVLNLADNGAHDVDYR